MKKLNKRPGKIAQTIEAYWCANCGVRCDSYCANSTTTPNYTLYNSGMNQVQY